MIKAIIFDFYGVLEQKMLPNRQLLGYIREKLKPKYKIGLISNALANFMPFILSSKDLTMFDDIVISYKIGVAKPEAGIYELALKNLGLKPEEAVFIDDIEVHCEGARAVGMQAIHYENFSQMKKELEKILAGSDD